MSRPRFRPLRPLATAVVVLLGAQVVVHVVTIDAVLDRIELDQRAVEEGGVTWDELDAASARWASAGRWGLLLLVTTAVAWCAWQFHGQTNLVKRHVSGLRNSPGWAVGWWFVPIANLWKPFQAMSELARASDDPDRWRAVRRPWTLIAWWLAWIGGTSITRVVSMQGAPTTLEEARRLDLAFAAASACTAVAAILGAVIVATVTASQERMAATAPPLFGEVVRDGGSREGRPPPRPDVAG